MHHVKSGCVVPMASSENAPQIEPKKSMLDVNITAKDILSAVQDVAI